MTVSSTTSRQTFACNGATTVFTLPFRVLASSEVVGYRITIADNSSSNLVNGVDFTVSGVGDANAVVTTSTAYSSAFQVKFVRQSSRLQLTDYRDNDPFPAEAHEEALDRLTHIAQELDGQAGRALLFPEPETGQTLPPASSRAGKALLFDSLGNLALAQIADVDGVIGVAFGAEAQTAAAGQTVFNLTLGSYVPGSESLTVHANGATLTLGDDYAETDATTVTTTNPWPAGTRFVFRYGRTVTSGVDALAVGYTPNGGAARSAASKFGELPSVVDKGADPTGAADSTSAFNASTSIPVIIPAGTYKTDTAPTGPTAAIVLGASFTGSNPWDSWIPAFGASATEVVATGSRNSLIGIAYNNLTSGTAAFPTGVTGYGRVSGDGNVVFGLFGRADLYATGGGVAANEVNSFNYAGTPSSAFPPNVAFGTTERSPVALIVAAGGTSDSHIGVMVAREGEAPRSFRCGVYTHPQAVTDYGVFVDSDASNGPTLPVLVKHKAGSVAMQLQTVGTAVPDNAVLTVVNPSASTVFSVRQNGRLAFTSGITQTTVGSAGGASALPATPTGYLKFLVGSTEFAIPYYAAA